MVEKVGVLSVALVVAFKIDDEVALGVSTNTAIICALDIELRSTGIFNTGSGATIEIEEAEGKLLNVDEIKGTAVALLEDAEFGKDLACNLVGAESELLETIFGKDRDITRWLEVNVEPDAGFGVILRTDLAVTDPDDADIGEAIVTSPA